MIYISNLKYVEDKLETGGLEFEHVITALPDAVNISNNGANQKNYLHLSVYDESSENLIDSCPKIWEFYETLGPNSPKLLIHCEAGQSRCVFVAFSILMKKYQINFETLSEKILADESSDFEPNLHLKNLNESFKKQLDLLSTMDYQINTSHGAYKNFRFNLLNFNSNNLSIYDLDRNKILWSSMEDQSKGKAYYRCGKCRKKLFKDSHVLKICPNRQNLYLEPIRWMAPMLFDPNLQDPMKGKLYCPVEKCAVKLGHFLWYGEKMTDGSWFGPAFNVSAKKFDRILFDFAVKESDIKF